MLILSEFTSSQASGVSAVRRTTQTLNHQGKRQGQKRQEGGRGNERRMERRKEPAPFLDNNEIC